MTQLENSPARKFLAPRRVAWLASVAGVGIAILAAGTGLQTPTSSPAWISSAVAAETVAQPRGFADLVERVRPAVISVRVRFDGVAQPTAMGEDNDNTMPFRQGSPFEKFFRQFGLEDMPNGTQNRQFGQNRQFRMPQTPQMQPRTAAEGSGFFISADGYAVTNNHVVSNAKTVQVITDDGKTLSAKVIGTDPNTDLAVREIRRSRAAHRRLGGSGRQSVRPRRHRDGGRRFRAWSQHRFWRGGLHPDRCTDQSRQF